MYQLFRLQARHCGRRSCRTVKATQFQHSFIQSSLLFRPFVYELQVPDFTPKTFKLGKSFNDQKVRPFISTFPFSVYSFPDELCTVQWKSTDVKEEHAIFIFRVYIKLSACPSTIKTEATCSCETSVDFLRPTRCYISEDRNLHSHSCENLKSCTLISCFLFFSFLLCFHLSPFFLY